MHRFNLIYAVIMVLAMLACTFMLRRTQTALPLPWWKKFGLGIGAFCGAMIGAKLPFVLSDWEGLLSGASWLANGKTIMCAIPGGYLGVEIAKWCLEVRVKTGDTFAAPVALAVAIGRVGCFQGGCCYGLPSKLPWAMPFALAPDGGAILRHPAQLYEAAFHLLMAAVLLTLMRNRLLQGQLIKFYILTYLAYRFFSEWLRPEAEFLAGLTAYQWAALAMFPVFVALWIYDARQRSRGPDAAIR